MGDASWSGSMPQEYEDGLGAALFRAPARSTARTVAQLLPRGGRLLELAAGTGIVTAELAALPGVEVVATDLNSAMVELGASRVPAAAWRTADALDLPEPDQAYDAVVCQFGVMFLPDKVAGLAEAGRVLRPGGHLVLTTWSPVADNEVPAAFVAALREVLPDDPPGFLERTPHGYADPDRVRDDLRAAGFADVAVREVRCTADPATARQVVRGFCRGTPLSAELTTHRDVDDLEHRLADAVAERLGEEPVTGRLTFLEAVAVAPGD